LQVQIDSGLLNETGKVNVSIYNISSGQASLCGDGGAGCEPFSVFYTLDGSVPNASSTIVCSKNLWRGDECQNAWKSTMSLQILGAVNLRVLVLRQGTHNDACVMFGQNLERYQINTSSVYAGAFTAGLGSPFSASVECNMGTEFSGFFKYTPLAPTVVLYPSALANDESNWCQ